MYTNIIMEILNYYFLVLSHLPLFTLVLETVIVGFHVFSNICK